MRPLAALLAAVLAAAALVACGGSDTPTTTAPAGEEGTSSGGKTAGSTESPPPKSGSGDKPGGSGDSDGRPRPEEISTPLRVSGGGSEQFRVKGGDNSIQEFGEESAESELEEAAAALHGFFVARAQEEWSKACSYLSPTMVEQIEQLSQRSSSLKGKDCAGILEGFTNPLPTRVRRETTRVDAASLRQEDGRAFLIFRGEGGTVFAIPMAQGDGGGWKVAALAGTPLS